MVSLMEIVNYFDEQKTLIGRGEKSVKASDIQEFRFEPQKEIFARVSASMRNKVYAVKVYLDGENIKMCECECAKGKEKCHHMAAALIYAHKHISCTDQPCSWSKPKEATSSKTCEELFGLPKRKLLKTKPTEEDKAFFVSSLKMDAPNCGFTWLLAPEPEQKSSEIFKKAFDEILKSPDYQSAENKIDFFLNAMKVEKKTVMEIFKQTVGQRNNSLWGVFRKGRITSSNFGDVIKAFKSSKVPPSLIKTLSGEYNLEVIKAVQWGIAHETTAVELFKRVKNATLHMGGIFLHSSGLIGCSPDAVVNDNALLEVKCPFSKSSTDIIDELYKNNWYVIASEKIEKAEHVIFGGVSIYEFKSNDMQLNLKHPQGYRYYHQIQGMLHIMEKECCYMLLWTPKSSIMFKVDKEPTWAENIKNILQFYKTIYIYYLLK